MEGGQWGQVSPERRKALASPPYQTIAVEKPSPECQALVRKSSEVFKFFVVRYSDLESELVSEVGTLSRFIYKNHNRFRNDRCLRILKQISKAGTTLVRDLRLGRLVENLQEMNPIASDLASGRRWIHLPSRQLAEHLLVRLCGAAELLWKLIGYCEAAGRCSLQRIRLGHFWGFGLVSLSSVSRLWVLFISTIILVEKAYSFAKVLKAMLPCSGVPWLLEGHELKEGLYRHVVGLGDTVSFEERFNTIVETCMDFPDISPKPEQPLTMSMDDPLGEVVDRVQPQVSEGEAEGLGMKLSNKEWEKLQKSTSNVTSNMECLEKFIQSEATVRKSNRKKALTKKLDKPQWKKLREQLNSIVDGWQANNKQTEWCGKSLLKRAKELMICWLLFPESQGLKPDNWDAVVNHLLNYNGL